MIKSWILVQFCNVRTPVFTHDYHHVHHAYHVLYHAIAQHSKHMHHFHCVEHIQYFLLLNHVQQVCNVKLVRHGQWGTNKMKNRHTEIYLVKRQYGIWICSLLLKNLYFCILRYDKLQLNFCSEGPLMITRKSNKWLAWHYNGS